MKRRMISIALALAALLFLAAGCAVPGGEEPLVTLEDLPAYSGAAYVAINGNEPYFTQSEITDEAYEMYSELDALGRCGVTCASVGPELMPTEERGDIGSVKPSGWHTVKYDCVDGKYLYNRCHLIGYQLTGENANEQNLITGTRYLNMEGMLPFENMVADYVEETGNHVMYRVTPIYEGDDLVARGVLMEGYSVEDEGDGILYCVFAYNVQPGVEIDYATGESWLAGEGAADSGDGLAYILNTGSMKFHDPACPSAADIKESNREEFTGSREELIARGFSPCGRCNP